MEKVRMSKRFVARGGAYAGALLMFLGVSSTVAVGLADPEDFKSDVGLPKNAVLGRSYTNGTRQEPGDRTNAVEGVMSLDLRDLEDRAQETKRN